MIRLLKVVVPVAAVVLGMAKAAPMPKDATEPSPYYFPTTVGFTWTFECDGIVREEVVTQVATVGDEKHVSVEQNTAIRGMVPKFTFALKQHGMSQLTSGPLPFVTEKVWVKKPVLKGQKWKHDDVSICVVEIEEVEVPAGKFATVRVDEEWHENGVYFRQSNWLAPGVGFVKRAWKVGTAGKEYVQVLKSFSPSKP